MPSSNWRLSEQSSAWLDFVKTLLVVQVVGGHLLALSAPKLQMLDLSMNSDVVLAALKAATSFGREAAFMFVCLSGFLTAKSIYSFHFPRAGSYVSLYV